MPTSPLRGTGFHPTSPLPFANLREQNENKAEAILNAKKDREQKEKDRERLLKEADRKLKTQFDSVSTEAKLLGLPQGQASVMSLGQLSGWVKASREAKVDEQKILEMNERRQRMEMARKDQERKERNEKDAQNARRILNFQQNTPQSTMQNIPGGWNDKNTQALAKQMGLEPTGSLMNAWYQAKEQKRNQGPLSITQKTIPGRKEQVPGQWKRKVIPPQTVNVMSGGGMGPTIVPKGPRPFDPSQIYTDPQNRFVASPQDMPIKMTSFPGSTSSASKNQVVTLQDGSTVLIDKTTGDRVSQIAGPPVGGWTQDDIEKEKKSIERKKEIIEGLEAQMGKASRFEKTSLLERIDKLQDDIKESRRQVSGWSGPSQQTPQAQKTPQAPQTPQYPTDIASYIDLSSGKVRKEWTDLRVSNPARAKELVMGWVRSGEITKEQARGLLGMRKQNVGP